MGKKKVTYAKPMAPLPEWARRLVLIVGDAIALFTFAALGRGSHGADNSKLPEIFWTAFPFLLGWFIVAPFFGLSRRNLELHPSKVLQRTLFAWIPAWAIAHVIRGIMKNNIPHWSFLLVSFIFGGFFLLVWRVLRSIALKAQKQ